MAFTLALRTWPRVSPVDYIIREVIVVNAYLSRFIGFFIRPESKDSLILGFTYS